MVNIPDFFVLLPNCGIRTSAVAVLITIMIATMMSTIVANFFVFIFHTSVVTLFGGSHSFYFGVGASFHMFYYCNMSIR